MSGVGGTRSTLIGDLSISLTKRCKILFIGIIAVGRYGEISYHELYRTIVFENSFESCSTKIGIFARDGPAGRSVARACISNEW